MNRAAGNRVAGWLAPDDPPPVTIENAAGAAPVVLACDHASNAVPAALDGLGLDRAALERHIAWDRGAAAVTRLLADRLDSPAVLAGYSRLVIDCNRRLGHETSIPVESDGTTVPGNTDLPPGAAADRAAAIFHPYHRAIGKTLAGIRARGATPVLLAIHSFTPSLGGVARPWHFGVLWDRDPRIPVPLLRALGAFDGLVVGDNRPYSGRLQYGYTTHAHGAAAGLPHALIEIREDLLRDPADLRRHAGIVGDALAGVLADPGLRRDGAAGRRV